MDEPTEHKRKSTLDIRIENAKRRTEVDRKKAIAPTDGLSKVRSKSA